MRCSVWSITLSFIIMQNARHEESIRVQIHPWEMPYSGDMKWNKTGTGGLNLIQESQPILTSLNLVWARVKINFIYSILKAVYKDVGNIVSRYRCRFRVGQEHVMMVMFHTTWAHGPPLHPYDCSQYLGSCGFNTTSMGPCSLSRGWIIQPIYGSILTCCWEDEVHPVQCHLYHRLKLEQNNYSFTSSISAKYHNRCSR